MKFPEWDSKKVLEWIQSCAIYFSLRPHEREDLWIREAGLHLTGVAKDWWEGKVKADPELTGELFNSWAIFTKRLRQQFGVHDLEAEAMTKLLSLQQDTKGLGSGMRYVDSFRELALRAGESEDSKVMKTIFERGLLSAYRRPFDSNPPTTLAGWYQCIEQLEHTWSRDASHYSTKPNQESTRTVPTMVRTPMYERKAIHSPQSHPRPVPQKSSTDRDSMSNTVTRAGDTDKAKLTPRTALASRQTPLRTLPRLDRDTCVLCNEKGHWAANCPTKERGVHIVMTEYGPAVLQDAAAFGDYTQSEDPSLEDETTLHEAYITEVDGEGDEEENGQGNGPGAQ
jgi:hypothetical protein